MNDKYAVGQTVLLFESGRRNAGPVEVPVTKVGRSLVYVQRYGWELAFYITDGRERRPKNAGGSGAVIYTQEEWAAKQARDEALGALRDRGIRFDHGAAERRVSTDQLQRIVAILDETQEEK